MARRPISFTFKGDSSGLARGVQAGVTGLRRLAGEMKDVDRVADRLDGKNVELDVKTDGLATLTARLQAMRTELQRDIEINPDVDVFGTITKLNRINREIDKIDRRRVDVDVNIDYDRNLLTRGLGSAFGGIARTLFKGFGQVLTQGISGSLKGALSAASSNPYVGAAAAGIGAAILASVASVIVAGAGAAIGGALSVGIAKAGLSLLEGFAGFEAADRRLKTVFGSMTQTIIDWSEAVSVRAGVGEVELQKMASGVQDLLVPRGFSRQDAAGLTQEIVERGIALAEFSGTDKALGIESVTKALLGEREQLKSLGVQIRQSDINDWLKDNADAVSGLSDGQAEVAATLAILEARSKDAWKAYNDGGSEAEKMMDTFNSTVANLKTDAIKGFGAIFVDVLGDIQENLNLDLGFTDGGLSQWIKDNKDSIKSFFLDIATVAVQGAIAFLEFSKAPIALVRPLLIAAQAGLQWAEAQTYVLQAMMGPIAWFGPLADGFTDIRNSLNASQDGVGAMSSAWDTLEPAITGAIDGGISKLGDLNTAIEGAKTGNDIVVAIKTEIKGKSIKEVREDLDGLTTQELTAVINVTENGTTKADEKINKAAKRERKARIQVDTDQRALQRAERSLDVLANPTGTGRKAKVTPEVGNTNGYTTTMNRLTASRKVYVTPVYTRPVNGYGSNNPSIGAQSYGEPQSTGGVVVQMNDGRLADYIGVSVAGQQATVQRTYNRRFGVHV